MYLQNKKFLFFTVTTVIVILIGLIIFWSTSYNKVPETVRYSSRGDAIDAALVLSQLHETGDATWQDLYTLGVTYMQLGETEKAVEVLEDAVRIKDDYPKLYESLGMGYYKSNQVEKSILTWEKGLALDPALEQLEILINDTRNKQAMINRVEVLVSEISGKEEVSWSRRFELASLYISIKQHDNAMEQLKLALETKKDSSDIYDLLAEISAQKGQFVEAIGYEEKALEFAPENETYAKRLEAMREILKARNSGDFHVPTEAEVGSEK